VSIGRWACLVLLAGCSSGGESEEEVTPRVPVGTTIVATDTIEDAVTVVGRLSATPGGSATLTAPAPAVVQKVLVQIGSRVGNGASLVELDAPELLTSARSLAAQADIAERDATRQQELLRQGITSQKQADERAADATAARSAAAAAQALLARTHVRSPIAGTVQEVSVHPGERVEAGATLVAVINATTLDLLAQVPAADLARLREGATASVVQDGDSVAVDGRVAALAPALDSLTNSGQAVIRFPNPHAALRPGAAATARIRLGKPRPALVISDSALVVIGDSLSVFVVGPDSVAHARPVGVGIRRSGRAEIRSGLKPGERVVTTGAFGLADGMKVVF
jgi:RND family efflux transporter MFP subunit